jgi:riboflavin kinase/FMN adenylyltransferase
VRAAGLLGRPYAVRGRVARGDARGRTLGFPTANLELPGAPVLADGVYAGRAEWDDGTAGAVVNVGRRPTFGGGGRLVEAHLLDVAPDLYGRRLAVSFLARLREERPFPSADALRAQIADDVRAARAALAAGS